MRLQAGDVGRLLTTWGVTSVALGVTGAALPGLSATSPWGYVGAAAITGVVGMLVRPVLVEVSARIGWLAVAIVAIAGQAIIIQIALELTPSVQSDGFGTTLAAAWIASFVATVLAWVTSAGTDAAFAASLRRRRRGRVQVVDDPEVDGMLFVQIDGLPFPVLQWALAAGNVPTLRRWMQDGGYRLVEWTPQMPCTTPASQLGILHGTIDRVPAFRWYDRELGRVLVANRPEDAAVIEARATDGHGLLAHDGVSVSNLFSGDAPRTAMAVSRLGPSRGSPETRRAVAWFLARPDGLARSITRTVGEVIKERFQAGRQHRRDMRPRVHRGWAFAGLRATSNAFLRDLNTAVVTEEMLHGTKVIYVDFVDYDEVAHHAGMFRPESLAALDGLDVVLASLAQAAEDAPRRYRIVVLSDHGQSQGDTFEQRHGQTLPQLCRELTASSVSAVDDAIEGWGRAESLLDDLSGDKGVTSRAADSMGRRVRTRVDVSTRDASGDDELVVVGSGNLGLVYAPGPERLDRAALDARWPNLLPGLAGHPGVGFIGVLDRDLGPVVLGRSGRRELRSGLVEGDDPLLGFPDHAADVLARAMAMREAPDVYVNSTVDEGTGDVLAFEPLVGCHGGLGGWQDRAVLLAPGDLLHDSDLPADGSKLVGADRLHTVLTSMLARCGQPAGRRVTT